MMKTDKKIKKQPPDSYYMPPEDWFHTFMIMNIPIAGWIYLRRLARGEGDSQLKDFAHAYLYYKLVFLVIGLVVVLILIILGAVALDQLLAYMEML